MTAPRSQFKEKMLLHEARFRGGALCATLLLSIPFQLQAQTATVPAEGSTARVIVKFKADSSLLSAKALGTPTNPAVRAAALSTRLGLPMTAGATVSEQAQVVFAEGVTSAELAQRLAQQSDVEYAVPDELRHFMTAPNDPLYADGIPGNGPAAGQWYLRAPTDTIKSSMNIEAAWAVTTGNPAIVVAVLDTGARYDHPDLGANLLPGYDMISDSVAANDGDGRDADASDPGDWITQAEISQRGSRFSQCTAENSSWHGTQTSGLIAALTDNGIGMASVGRNVKVLPVRVLGKCGGFDSDIIAGMRWAAGLSVPGVPANPNKARVINMSLGGDGQCGAAYQQAVNDVTAAGTVIVVSAGNSSGAAVSTPGNCSGVITVAGLRHVGTKVGFSSLGPEVAISAPGGNCVNTTANSPCLYPILTTTNTGTTVPVGFTWSDSFNRSLGTSFSAPLVTGTVALMLSVQPSMTPQQVKQVLQAAARPFPASDSIPNIGTPLPVCTAPRFDGSGKAIDQTECHCTTATCGAGILDAGAALLATKSGAPGTAVLTVVEFYNASLDHYFITWAADEIAKLGAGTEIKGWTRTGKTMNTYVTAQPGTSPVCRFYIPPAVGNSHFFGRGTTECDATAAKHPSFVLEDPAFMQMFLPVLGVCPSNTTQVYRVFSNRQDANHRYMTEKATRDQMRALGWLVEGDGPDFVVMCAPQ
ncbi:MAG: S8 family peptidase [Vicinamibacterales bacterium]